MLSYLKLENQQYTPTTPEEILADDAPIPIFLGGLLHLNREGLGGGLARILSDMMPDRQKRVYIAFRSSEPNIAKTASDMYAFANTSSLSVEAMSLCSKILLPPSVRGGDITALRAHLGRVNLLGYSYGTSLIQQCEKIVFEDIKALGATNQETCALMNAVGAVSLGPVAQPALVDEKGDVNKFVPGATNGRSCFSQYIVCRSTDKITQDVLGKKFVVQPRPETSCLDLAVQDETVLVIDKSGDGFLRQIGFNLLSSGMRFPIIKCQFDSEGHDLRLYTNRLSKDGRLLTYPSSISGTITQSAVQGMIRESQDVSRGIKRRFHHAAAHKLSLVENVEKLNDELSRMHRQFNDVVNVYHHAHLDEATSILDDHLSDMNRVINQSLDKNPN